MGSRDETQVGREARDLVIVGVVGSADPANRRHNGPADANRIIRVARPGTWIPSRCRTR